MQVHLTQQNSNRERTFEVVEIHETSEMVVEALSLRGTDGQMTIQGKRGAMLYFMVFADGSARTIDMKANVIINYPADRVRFSG